MEESRRDFTIYVTTLDQIFSCSLAVGIALQERVRIVCFLGLVDIIKWLLMLRFNG